LNEWNASTFLCTKLFLVIPLLLLHFTVAVRPFVVIVLRRQVPVLTVPLPLPHSPGFTQQQQQQHPALKQRNFKGWGDMQEEEK